MDARKGKLRQFYFARKDILNHSVFARKDILYMRLYSQIFIPTSFATRISSRWGLITELAGYGQCYDYIEYLAEYAPLQTEDYENLSRACELHNMGSILKVDFQNRFWTAQKALADFFEETVALGAEPKQAANWIMGEVLRRLSADGLEAKDMAFTPKTLARLIELVQTGKLNRNTAVKVFDAVFVADGDVDAYVKEHGLEQVSDAWLVGRAVEQVLAANPKSIEDYRAGKEKAFGFLVGQVMRELKGRALPQVVNQTIREKLEQMK